MRLVNGVGRVAGRALGPRPSLAAEALRAEAVARTGFDDFGPLAPAHLQSVAVGEIS